MHGEDRLQLTQSSERDFHMNVMAMQGKSLIRPKHHIYSLWVSVADLMEGRPALVVQPPPFYQNSL